MGGYWNDIVETKIVCAIAPSVLQESRGQGNNTCFSQTQVSLFIPGSRNCLCHTAVVTEASGSHSKRMQTTHNMLQHCAKNGG